MITIDYLPQPASLPVRGLHDARTEIRIGAALIATFVIGFLGWSALAHLDAAIHVPGVVRVVGSRQAVQSFAGGVVTGIHVREGDRVKAGQILVDFADTEALSLERSFASRVIGLQAEIARIGAEQHGAARIAAPPEWSILNADERTAADQALVAEQTNLDAGRTLIASEQAVLRQRVRQVDYQVAGYRQRQTANVRQNALNVDELSGVQEMFKKGYATKTRVLALQRSAASITGDIGSTTAEIARLRSSAGEAQLQMLQMVNQRAQQNTERLRLAQTELQTLLPQWRSAREQLALAATRAPVSGTVLGLVANTVGGVMPRGQRLMDIVPDSDALEIETHIAPNEAVELRGGQSADVRIGGLHDSQASLLHGQVSRVSPDTIVDEKTGLSYYNVIVTVPREALREASRQAGFNAVKPGSAVDVTVLLKSRTALDYFLNPLLSRLRPALSEQ
ncbi:HlyD family type I secretion periplasmic adaptor subunit [Sphingomonas sp.]|uniref:HlyD family type I secretion periplasmic adaptor subunit n=1 Tax=Sphingomonas sp. TaxID=28214 RepID=UPI0025DF9ADE|nr:HlyD family type I secretion periplasmic adaptor subunit [Sphingomonas sp.]